jgi:hypothetical protein
MSAQKKKNLIEKGLILLCWRTVAQNAGLGRLFEIKLKIGKESPFSSYTFQFIDAEKEKDHIKDVKLLVTRDPVDLYIQCV